MPLFKKKKKQTRPNTQVYMPYKKSTPVIVKRKKKKFSFVKKTGSKKTRKRNVINISHVFFYLILPIIVLALLYVTTLFVLNRRSGSSDNSPEEYVIGLEKVPVFVDSETHRKAQFIFSNTLEEPSVANFIGSGNSAYRIPTGSNVDSVFEFYQNILPTKGWEFIQFVDIASEEMKNGQYWSMGNKGLRIYSKFNDIWYEMITKEQALTGLRDRIEKEIERELLLANQELQDLLPDFPWVLKVPKEYIISYRAAKFEDMRLVEFKRLGSDEIITITPIGYTTNKPLDNFLREYIDIINTQDENVVWNITNTILIYTEHGRGLKGSISSASGSHDIVVLPNSYDKTGYVVDSNIPDNPFFDYIINSLTPQGLKRD